MMLDARGAQAHALRVLSVVPLVPRHHDFIFPAATDPSAPEVQSWGAGKPQAILCEKHGCWKETNTPLLPDYCRTVMPWSALTDFKVSGVYLLPADMQVAATFQNLPGVVDGASFAATNAQIAPSLGRNLAACGTIAPCTATVVVSNLLVPNTMFEDRLNQVDLRFSKIVRIGGARVQGMLDIYNLFNANTILDVNTRIGPNWLRPNSILSARLFKFGVQLDF